jgi:hypothetical protein
MLAKNRPQYLGAQSVTGEILKTNDFAPTRRIEHIRCREAMMRLDCGTRQGHTSQASVDFEIDGRGARKKPLPKQGPGLRPKLIRK